MTLDEAKQEVATQNGFENWEHLRVSEPFLVETHIKLVAELYMTTNRDEAVREERAEAERWEEKAILLQAELNALKEAQPKWISVEEGGFPEKSGNYIVANENLQQGYQEPSWFSKSTNSFLIKMKVTHWMPIPPFKP